MILHQPAGDTVAGYRILEKAHQEGKIRAIGLSNFDVAQTQRILDECEVVPAINQVECHPYFPQTELKELLKEHNIALQAWYPLGGRGNDSIMPEPLVQGLAEKHGKSPAQVLLRSPEVMMLDEPVSALDMRYQVVLMDHLHKQTRAHNWITVTILHDLNLAATFCDEVLVLHKGRAVCLGRPADVLTEDLIREVYGVEVRILHPDGDETLLFQFLRPVTQT